MITRRVFRCTVGDPPFAFCSQRLIRTPEVQSSHLFVWVQGRTQACPLGALFGGRSRFGAVTVHEIRGTAVTSVRAGISRIPVANGPLGSQLLKPITLRIGPCAKHTASDSSFHRTPCPQLPVIQIRIAPMERPPLDSQLVAIPHEIDG